MHKITLIPGDGIGPSIVDAAVKVIEATGVQVQWDTQSAGMAAVEKFGTPLPDATLDSIRANRICFKGPLTTPVGGGYRSVNVTLRQAFNLYANVRPAISFEGTDTAFSDVNLVTVRENTEGLYAGIEHFIKVDEEKIAAESIAVVTRKGSERIIRYAFDYARRARRKKVTLVHKANILKCTSGLFLEIGREIAKEYPDIEFDDRIVDACSMQMVMQPQRFDVLVTTNLFGDILSDLAAGLIGGLGLTAGANIGTDAALFEAVHGSAPDIADKGIANPTAMIMAGAMMLEHIGEPDAARRIERAVREVIEDGRSVTPDLAKDSPCGTAQMAEAIVERVRQA
ncbi:MULTISPECIES: isocitrate/isopropylmalate dehydrogenase family protein [Methylococcus]|jgi:isocitrate dehydrogenase (NAD+)|uniref:Putative isocitrate dehydrogenase, NAD-dependent n=1 Tax=Methylococcus capsulatus (strain ATCC 33009 / NCIMB 11132 / Bath) TaxID=243233 RepID=Q602J2_METCA|nr:isocitrate/isopropylmalate family dehydrogenase [Methylococcus capsulatus]AAU90861.1 putative isocitrate dehydrogenase, NAD-dependent [Methylococcus capsulatus str. Bath]QXP86527.1 NAD-dependent isocitrate dehydrogenase [Methylococcus capsulatus]QXP89254.1 NAD-dependent isocitrate dehydrogenase [Methylococcus capsulatus]QXP93803.1 NAD-dependent isocitrate dehydrogenase [Methylococcus capsulatus]UQN11475.1 isocitrate/isopropylmalate family dehydrogenase [Methylococcus capsulatus]